MNKALKGFDIDEILEQAIQKREYKEFNDYKIPSLPEIENGLVLLGHLNQHLSAYDLGLRQILDWEMYVYKVLDKTRWNIDFLPIAEKVGLKKLAVNVTVMCMEYLGLPNNIGLKGDHGNDISGSLLNLLFESGNFGRKITKSTQNNNNGVISTGIYQIKKNSFFPYFQDMGLKRWKLCQKHKFFRPFAWIYGIFRSIGLGIKSIFKPGNVKKQISAGNEKYILFEKLGVQASSKK